MLSMKITKKGQQPPSDLQATTASIFQFDDSDNEINQGMGEDTFNSDLRCSNLNAVDHKDLGCALAERGEEGDMRNALSHFEQGLVLEPTNHLLWELKSQVLLHFDKYLLAIEAAEEVVRIAPLWSEGFVTLARAQREFGEIELAFENMQRAIALDEANSDHVLELSEIEGSVKKLLAARAAYEREGETAATFSCGDPSSCLLVHPSDSSSSTAVPATAPLPRCFTRMSVFSSSDPPLSSSSIP